MTDHERAVMQQALDVLNLVSDEGESKFPATIQGAISDLEAALAQQAEPNVEYERGFIDGMQKQAQSSVDRAVNRMAEPVQEPVEPLGQLAELQAMLRAEVDRLIAAGIQPQRKPLTDEEIAVLEAKYAPPVHPDFADSDDWVDLIRAVERAHGIREDA